jgi:hypothetical protein
VASETAFTLRVSVSDGVAPAVQGSVQVTVTIPAYAAKVQPVFTQNCSCHMGAFPSGGLTLAAGQSYADLVDVAATACAPLKRVLPGDPDQSVLVRKITGNTCGGRMPASDTGFFDRNPGLVDRMRSWILAGAAND